MTTTATTRANPRHVSFADATIPQEKIPPGLRARMIRLHNRRVIVADVEGGCFIHVKRLDEQRRVSHLGFGMSKEAAAALGYLLLFPNEGN